jgi:hypothetical protein
MEAPNEITQHITRADIYAFLFHTLGVTPNYSEVSRVR